MGDKFGRDPIWEGHLAHEMWQAEAEVNAVLYEGLLPLKRLMNLEVGETLVLDLKPDALVKVRCGEVVLTEGRMGHVGERIAVSVASPLRHSRTTMSMFENAGTMKRTEAQ
jgi:flagellar motor switch protein FliM